MQNKKKGVALAEITHFPFPSHVQNFIAGKGAPSETVLSESLERTQAFLWIFLSHNYRRIGLHIFLGEKVWFF